MIRVPLHLRLWIVLVMTAAGALCGVAFDLCMVARSKSAGRVARGAWDVVFCLLAAAVLTLFWYRADRLQGHYTTSLGAVLGWIIYRLGPSFYVRLCLKKCSNTICCRRGKRPEKTSKKHEK